MCLGGCQYFTGGVSTDPSDGPVHSRFGDGEGFAALTGSSGRVNDCVGVLARVGVDADDEVGLFCHAGHDGDPSFQSSAVIAGIGLVLKSCPANL